MPFRIFEREAGKRAKKRSIHLGLMITPQTPNLTPFQTNIPDVGETIFPDFLQFLAEESKKGRFWVVSEFPSDRVLFLTDNTDPNWVKIPTHQIIGMDRMNSWRDSMDDYDRLQHLLMTDGVAPQFVNKGYRLDDSFCQFQKTHYLIDGLFGTQCRASVSEGRELLRLAPDVK
ncbi:MAG: hypothetical protein J7647_15660 [Cyanobacteria bacterium SBLK]|nr:hypothetical protein [Cyanobacteria bacterium SBLK]